MVIRGREDRPDIERIIGDDDYNPYDRERGGDDIGSIIFLNTKHPITGEQIKLTREQYQEVIESEDPVSMIDSFLTKEELETIDDIEINENREDIVVGGGRKVFGRSAIFNWSEIRKTFVLGKRKQTTDGTWISENYTLKEIAEKFGVGYYYLKQKSASEGWSKLRKAYLARVNEVNVGQELGLYTSENYQSEINAINACNKLSAVLNSYIEYKFGSIIDHCEDINSLDGEGLPENIERQMNVINQNTGMPVFINEIKEAVKVTTDIYKLQRTVYENSPQANTELVENLMKNKKTFKNEQQRKAKLTELQAKLSVLLKPGEELNTYAVEDIYSEDDEIGVDLA